MSEEKKAINQLKAVTNFYDYELKNGKYIYEHFKIEVYKKDVDTVLDLINRQQKELEQEKEKNKELEIIKNGIEILKSNFVNDETYYVISKNDFINKDYKNLLNNYVSKDKIRAKIEELNKTIYKGEIPEFYTIYRYTADVLEELLEE